MGKRGPKPRDEQGVDVNAEGMVVEENDFVQVPEKKDTPTPPNLTSEEAAIFQRVKSEDDDWKTITEDDVFDYSLSEYPYSLPEPAQKLLDEHKFAFRYAEMDPKRIDQLRNGNTPNKWWICNRTNFPYWPDKLWDSIHGAHQHLDQILMFQPYWMKDRRDQARDGLAKLQMEGGTVEKKDGAAADDTGSEWVSGKKARISSTRDEVVSSDAMDQMYAEEAAKESSDGLGDLIVGQ